MPEFVAEMTPSDIVAGEELLARFAELARAGAHEPGDRIGTTATAGQQFSAQIAMHLKVEWIVFALRARRDGVTIDMADPISVLLSDQAFVRSIGDHQALALELGGKGLEDLYLAARHATRLANNSASGRKNAELIPPGGDLGFPPALIVIAVIGVAAVAGATWWGVDRNEKQVAISNHAAELTAQVDQYSRWLDDQLRRGNPAAPPPPFVTAAAATERGYPWWALGTGLVLGGVAVVGVVMGFKHKDRIGRAYTVLRENPSRRRRRRNPYVRQYRRRAEVKGHFRAPAKKSGEGAPEPKPKRTIPGLPPAPAKRKAKVKRKRKRNPISRKRKAARKAAVTRVARKRHAKRAPIARGQGAKRARAKKAAKRTPKKRASKRRTKKA